MGNPEVLIIHYPFCEHTSITHKTTLTNSDKGRYYSLDISERKITLPLLIYNASVFNSQLKC